MRNAQRMAVRMPTNLSLPRDLIRKVDEVAGPRNRSAFVEDAVRSALRREQLRLAVASTSGAWKDRGQSAWDEPDGVVNMGPGPAIRETRAGRELLNVRYLLDTTFVIDHLRGDSAAAVLMARLFADGDQLMVNEIVVCEAATGLPPPGP